MFGVIKDLDQVVQTLLHKCSESNAFLREVVDKSMLEMTNCVSPAKALTALIMGGMQYVENSMLLECTATLCCCTDIATLKCGR